VKDIGIQVHPVRPGDRSGHLVDPDLSEDDGIAQILENTTLEDRI
jgi:hypothetical protein